MGAVLPVLEGTRFPKSLRPVPESPSSSKLTQGLYVLKSASTNNKIGKGSQLITKGPWRGMQVFTLTLEERATCWEGCQQWDNCYGNNMRFAGRYAHGPELDAALDHDVAVLAARYPEGVVIRLHVLGDFYSPEYVAAWADRLTRHPNVHVFGYTHWPEDTPIGQAVTDWVASDRRVSIRRSDGVQHADALPVALVVAAEAPAIPGTVLCPEQTGQSHSCLTCGLCMNMQTDITFRTH